MVKAAASSETTYALSKQINITFSPYEDRLIVRSLDAQQHSVILLLTRRMVMITLQQLLAKLPELTGLNRTPAEYWQEVLQMAHQRAMKAKGQTDMAQTRSAAPQDNPATAESESVSAAALSIYLATELTVRLQEKELVLAFKGLPMPQAMTSPSTHEPVFATPLQADHVHQLIQLLISKSQEAHWHLPVDLPWLENPQPGATSLAVSPLH